ncbi:tRNA (guanosine(37)-N1)-methyltransferase TrmD [Arsenicitalea aurantiaca]|uniref:tRNA (guanine-N(1)-)-methyltransferase n=1 Tax=Arsenicitalea aurantiaca TaxID=1783274 RepID=A0A433X7K4_9HYPH|nr:tRNA (guanosine(37)-N1)-methyltransferase TrmD [Arsenicitalea aurantiaca]RUT30035.1 tRNA (guanosine(37)-N1)-methyltransferase TrmD [Arsenicitalea aurantiaca]
MSFRADVITLFPELFPGPLGASILGRALAEGRWQLAATQLRDFATDRHRTVDDTPSGGGPGMVLKPDILARAIDAIAPEGDLRPKLLMSPRGRPLDQQRVRELAAGPGALIVCGRFEGVDQRVIEARGLEEVSIGDYVLAGGEVAAMVLLEAVVRLIPGVLGAAESSHEESFEGDLLEYPQYTRPALFEGLAIPEVLVSGDHGKIARWRQQEAEALTARRRPDLLARSRKKAIGKAK